MSPYPVCITFSSFCLQHQWFVNLTIAQNLSTTIKEPVKCQPMDSLPYRRLCTQLQLPNIFVVDVSVCLFVCCGACLFAGYLKLSIQLQSVASSNNYYLKTKWFFSGRQISADRK